ncbi:MAG: AMP-binding protein [Deltaproteobacteria bacterium]|nr:AMP-binding protein [Candidatus Anaeroferrophillus wilburensis]MBN2887796.1 AMP-binding protein [Deltaproteobacteria bacterium]
MTAQRSSYLHRGGDEPLLGATIYAHAARIMAAYPDHEAVVSLPQNRRLTYRELRQEADSLARGLLALGYGSGDRIGIWSTNNLQWIVLQLATARIGAVLVTINPAYRPKELSYALRRSHVQGLFVIPAFRTSDYAAMLAGLLPSLAWATAGALDDDQVPALRHVILYDPANPAATSRPSSGFTLWQDVMAAAEQIKEEQLEAVTAGLDFDDPINIQYTSGTTGTPKAVELSHHNILNNAYFAARSLGFTAVDRLCVPVPFYHCFGLVLGNLLCLSVGACIVIPCDYFEPSAVLRGIAEERCTAVHGVPTMFIAELEHPGFADFDLSSLRTGIMAGAPCAPDLVERVITRMHCSRILIGYGQTEASPLTHLTAANDNLVRRTTTVGTNLPHQEVKVVSPRHGTILPRGEIGEVCFRGYQVMKGYYDDPDATGKAIDHHGWLHSGDLGWLDEDGYLHISGRLKEMIIRGGENIYPREIEDFLVSHPDILQVAVFGVPDPRMGEEIVAWVQLRPGLKITATELKEYCRGAIAHFKIPRHICFVDAFPLTVTGKPAKFRMREKFMQEHDLM